MAHARAGAHHLHVARAGAAAIAKRILVGDRAGADIGDDLHVRVRMRREAGLGPDLVVVPHPKGAPAHATGVMPTGEGEMVARVQPAMIRVAELRKGTVLYHASEDRRAG